MRLKVSHGPFSKGVKGLFVVLDERYLVIAVVVHAGQPEMAANAGETARDVAAGAGTRAVRCWGGDAG
jgi:hypothetical protein